MIRVDKGDGRRDTMVDVETLTGTTVNIPSIIDGLDGKTCGGT